MGAIREGVWNERTGVVPVPPLDRRRLAFQAGGVALFSAVAGLVALPHGIALPTASVVAAFATFGLMGRREDDRRGAAREEVLALREAFGAGPVWTVDLLIRQGDAPTGRDQGLLWVEGGRIVYAGLRTSFALMPSQLAGPVHHEAAVSGIRLRLNLRLRRETPAGGLSLSFWPLSEGQRRRENDAADLRFALNTVLEDHVETPFAEGQWPPVALGCDAPPARVLLRGAVGRVLAWVAFSAVAGLVIAGLNVWAGLGFFLLIAVGSNWAFGFENRPRWKAWRDRKRLDGR